MQSSSLILLGTAASLGFFHTLVGVDHTLPFVVLARAQRWHLGRLLWVTAVCGLLHVLSSVVLGAVGVALGVAIDKLSWIEAVRGGLAAWMLIAMGLGYAAWGFVRARRDARHSHAHAHADGVVHDHDHDHHREHLHVHGAARALSMVGLFAVFVLGPCEVLIPMLMAPAFEKSWVTVALVVAVFGATTVATMLGIVTLGHLGLQRWRFGGVERHLHALSGLAIAASGVAIQVVGV